MQSERTSDQTFAGWNIERIGETSVLHTGTAKPGLYKGEGVPLLDPEALVVYWGSTGAKQGACLLTPRFSSRGELGTLRTLSISWISDLCSSTLSLPYSMCGRFAPLLRFSSISRITLDQIAWEGGILGKWW